MLLFNLMDISNYVHPRTYFNTSNVTIQLPCINFLLLCQADFNTSNVTIQQFCNLCCVLWYGISIHLMLLFNMAERRRRRGRNSISIHLMLLFNQLSLRLSLVSCHFNTSNVTIQRNPQNCISEKKPHFNTSNVTIQRFNVNLCWSWDTISIHLMLLFNKIQYIMNCEKIIISIHLMLLFNLTKHLFRYTLIHFNTSNVTIQRQFPTALVHRKYISIHLMLLFNHVFATPIL